MGIPGACRTRSLPRPLGGAWAVFGSALRKILRDPVKVRTFNLLMAVLLVASMLPIVLDLAPLSQTP